MPQELRGEDVWEVLRPLRAQVVLEELHEGALKLIDIYAVTLFVEDQFHGPEIALQ